MMANSLGFDPEWGGIDFLEDIEATFGIKIADVDAERCWTVGELYEVLCSHSANWSDKDGKCSSAMVFYRLRRSLAPNNRRSFVPDTPLVACGLQPSRLFRKLAHDTGLRLPVHRQTGLGIAGLILIFGGIFAGIGALLAGNWIVSGSVALVGLAGFSLLRLDPGRFPDGIVTVSDLVRRVTSLNVARLREAGGRPADRWSVLTALAAEHGFLSPDEIVPETLFHRLEQTRAR